MLMIPTPTWLKVARVFCLIGLPAMAVNVWMDWTQATGKLEQTLPTASILLACTHLVFRAPYKRWSHWEIPLVSFSLGAVSVGAFLFKPEDEEHILGFQLFLATFAFLATAYGFFCTAVKHNHRFREQVIEPTKKVARFGIIGFDIGLVCCPFAFVFFLIRALARR